MTTPLHPIFAQALAPFAPPSSNVHEQARQADDLAYNRLKTSGQLRQQEDWRALERQIREGGVLL